MKFRYLFIFALAGLYAVQTFLAVRAAEVSTWDTTAANNNSAAPDGWPENMAPSGVNDSAREMMAAIARRVTDGAFTVLSTGSANAYSVTAAQTIASYSTGQVFGWIASFANTATATVTVDSVGAKEIVKRHDQGLSEGDIEAGQFVLIAYEASTDRFQMLTPAARPDRFESAEQTITAAGALTLAHSLGVTPDRFAAYLVNQTAEIGYQPGAPVWISIGGAGTNRGMAVTADAFNIYIRYGSDANTFELLGATSGSTTSITNGRWRLVIKAFN